LRSVRLYFTTFFCRLSPQICGNGNLIQLEVIQSGSLSTLYFTAASFGYSCRSYIDVPLGLFNRWFGRGLTCRRQILKICQILFCNLLIHQVVHERGASFCNLFGSCVFELFGTKERTGYLIKIL
jgi:hypothetical protein